MARHLNPAAAATDVAVANWTSIVLARGPDKVGRPVNPAEATEVVSRAVAEHRAASAANLRNVVDTSVAARAHVREVFIETSGVIPLMRIATLGAVSEQEARRHIAPAVDIAATLIDAASALVGLWRNRGF